MAGRAHGDEMLEFVRFYVRSEMAIRNAMVDMKTASKIFLGNATRATGEPVSLSGARLLRLPVGPPTPRLCPDLHNCIRLLRGPGLATFGAAQMEL